MNDDDKRKAEEAIAYGSKIATKSMAEARLRWEAAQAEREKANSEKETSDNKKNEQTSSKGGCGIM